MCGEDRQCLSEIEKSSDNVDESTKASIYCFMFYHTIFSIMYPEHTIHVCRQLAFYLFS